MVISTVNEKIVSGLVIDDDPYSAQVQTWTGDPLVEFGEFRLDGFEVCNVQSAVLPLPARPTQLEDGMIPRLKKPRQVGGVLDAMPLAYWPIQGSADSSGTGRLNRAFSIMARFPIDSGNGLWDKLHQWRTRRLLRSVSSSLSKSPVLMDRHNAAIAEIHLGFMRARRTGDLKCALRGFARAFDICESLPRGAKRDAARLAIACGDMSLALGYLRDVAAAFDKKSPGDKSDAAILAENFSASAEYAEFVMFHWQETGLDENAARRVVREACRSAVEPLKVLAAGGSRLSDELIIECAERIAGLAYRARDASWEGLFYAAEALACAAVVADRLDRPLKAAGHYRQSGYLYAASNEGSRGVERAHVQMMSAARRSRNDLQQRAKDLAAAAKFGFKKLELDLRCPFLSPLRIPALHADMACLYMEAAEACAAADDREKSVTFWSKGLDEAMKVIERLVYYLERVDVGRFREMSGFANSAAVFLQNMLSAAKDPAEKDLFTRLLKKALGAEVAVSFFRMFPGLMKQVVSENPIDERRSLVNLRRIFKCLNSSAEPVVTIFIRQTMMLLHSELAARTRAPDDTIGLACCFTQLGEAYTYAGKMELALSSYEAARDALIGLRTPEAMDLSERAARIVRMLSSEEVAGPAMRQISGLLVRNVDAVGVLEGEARELNGVLAAIRYQSETDAIAIEDPVFYVRAPLAIEVPDGVVKIPLTLSISNPGGSTAGPGSNVN